MESLESSLYIRGAAEPLLEAVAIRSKPYYEPSLPYHNWDEHIVDTFNKSMRLNTTCEEHGLSPNLLVVGSAALLHDAGFARKFDEGRFGCKEEYSAEIAEGVLADLGFDQEVIDEVEICIMGTKCGEDCPTLESKIMRRADLANIAGSYHGFITSTLKLMEETKILTGKVPSWSEWKKSTRAILDSYLAQDLSFGEFERDEQGQYGFLRRSRENIEQMAKDSRERIASMLGDQAARFASVLSMSNGNG